MKKVITFSLILFCSLLILTGISFATNPFTDFFNIPTTPTTTTPPVIEETEKNPFLHEFLRVYEGDWIYVSNIKGPYYSVDVFKEPNVCNVDETECCGRFKIMPFGTNSTEEIIEGLFCLASTYEIHLKDLDKKWDIQCVGVRGGRIESPLHIPLPGYAIDDPTYIDCQIFRLVRPE